jgi:DNA-binding response OmpR family regulator
MNQKLLVINRENNDQKILAEMFGSEYTVVIKNDGLEALEWMEKDNQADLIIADLNMAHLTMADFIKSVRHHTFFRHTPILVVVDVANLTERSKYIALGANDFVVKPLGVEEFHIRVKNTLERPSEKRPMV